MKAVGMVGQPDPHRLVEVALALSLLLAAGAARGQESLEGPPTLQFSFSNPGARSMGFAGAFVALADDATAAFANPAGLVQLLQPEVSLEARNWSYATAFTERGRIEGAPSGVGIDTRRKLSFQRRLGRELLCYQLLLTRETPSPGDGEKQSRIRYSFRI
jgi:hypothetical protein